MTSDIPKLAVPAVAEPIQFGTVGQTSPLAGAVAPGSVNAPSGSAVPVVGGKDTSPIGAEPDEPFNVDFACVLLAVDVAKQPYGQNQR